MLLNDLSFNICTAGQWGLETLGKALRSYRTLDSGPSPSPPGCLPMKWALLWLPRTHLLLPTVVLVLHQPQPQVPRNQSCPHLHQPQPQAHPNQSWPHLQASKLLLPAQVALPSGLSVAASSCYLDLHPNVTSKRSLPNHLLIGTPNNSHLDFVSCWLVNFKNWDQTAFTCSFTQTPAQGGTWKVLDKYLHEQMRDWETVSVNKWDAGKDWRQKGMTGEEMVGWHHQLSGHEFEQTQGDSGGQRSLGCYNLWSGKESDTTEQLNKNNREADWVISHAQLKHKGPAQLPKVPSMPSQFSNKTNPKICGWWGGSSWEKSPYVRMGSGIMPSYVFLFIEHWLPGKQTWRSLFNSQPPCVWSPWWLPHQE